MRVVKPGTTRRPLRSMSQVFGPESAFTSALVPTFRMRPCQTAMAWASGLVGSPVHTRAFQ